MFFNVSCEKLGRPGRFGDVMNAVSLSLPTRPRNLLHIETLASTVNSTAVQIITMYGHSSQENCQQNGNKESSGSTLHLRRIARFSL